MPNTYCHNSSMADQHAHDLGEEEKAEHRKERQREELFQLLIEGSTIIINGKEYGPEQLIEHAVNDDADAFDADVIEAAQGRFADLSKLLDKAANEIIEVLIP